MIRKIHYVWLGGKPLPASVKSCINNWAKINPNWDIIQWNENNFPIGKYRWVNEAINNKAYAFASDFIRLWVLYHYGGAYCDTDVSFVRPIEKSLQNDFVCGIENLLVGTDEIKYMTAEGYDERTGKVMQCFGMQTGFLYSEPKHPFVQYCMSEIYKKGQRNFIKDNGMPDKLIIDAALIWALKDFGFIFKDETQTLCPNITIYNSEVFATPPYL